MKLIIVSIIVYYFQVMDSLLNSRGIAQPRWDLDNLEIRTKSVEQTLEPLVTQVCGFLKYFADWCTGWQLESQDQTKGRRFRAS